MAALTVLFWLCLIFIGVQIVTLLINLWAFPVLKPALKPFDKDDVTLLIPARNEAETLPETLPRVLAQGAKVIVLDDSSEDATADIVRSLQLGEGQLELLSGKPLPAGWSGKNWACQQLSEAVTTGVFIFTDADVLWEPCALDSVLAFRASKTAEFVSVWPRQLTYSLWERVTVSLIDQILLSALPYLGVRYSSSASFCAGNGQMMLWSRAGYERVGGHAAFRSEVLEDVRMAQAAKREGLKVALSLGGAMMATRMYRTDAALIEGFSKNILAASGSASALFFTLVINTLIHSLSWLLAFVQPIWLVVAGLSLTQRFLTHLKTGRSLPDTLLQPLTSFFTWRIGLRALWARGDYTWKGRAYASGASPDGVSRGEEQSEER